jgi:sec-independent protein translocase protein TatA
MANLTGWHLLILLAVILLLFGAARLPALAKSIGQSARVFRGEMKQLKAEDETTGADGTAGATTTAPRPDQVAAPGEQRTDDPGKPTKL